MKHPYIVNANANERLNHMLVEAETQRRIKRLSANKTRRNIFKELKGRLPVSKGRRLDESANSPA